ncbi:vacuolar protein sorting-associated protein 72 homolog isoform X2 [Anopheles arabiensis]|uniref:vacuolar protein sorting-associated protein 72 homolog isoform X2 n=1 Tax=Anopheles arabiensis TaxID=7173 RepID=UPI001AADD587|nr:vacuolar protein sorting-associated protein 72 homolog isoform X2 [Anopheles arabiensis]
MAATRERRSNAGRRMATLLNEEEEDEFYKTSYGGFSETADDGDYVQKNDDEEDIVDSDFSIDENDEPISDAEEEPAKGSKRRKVGTVTKAYREPAPKKQTPAKAKEPKAKAERQSTLRKRPKFTVIDSGRKSFRKSTAAKTAATQSRLKQRFEAERKRTRVIRTEEYIPTQEELLEEAEITERENIKSLERFRRMELEKQKIRPTKKKFTGPTIRYFSTAMPIIEEVYDSNTEVDPLSISDPKEAEDTNDKTAREKTVKRSRSKKTTLMEVTGQYERTFITFENDIDNKLFESYFPTPDAARKHRQVCAVTRLPARYYDPITQLPYRNMQAFKILREAYYQQLEERGNTDNPDVARWLEWRKKIKEYRMTAMKKLQPPKPPTTVAAAATTTAIFGTAA